MSRSTKIFSRIIRNLKHYDIQGSDFEDEEIYDEIQNAQDRIISDVFPDKIITITLEDGKDSYSLGTSSEKKNIASVKTAKLPAGWVTSDTSDFSNILVLPDGFTIVPNNVFVDYVNNLPDQTGRPRIGTIIDSQLKFYPVPTSDEDGEDLDFYTYLSASSGTIDEDNDPELPEYFDKALELDATGQFLKPEDRGGWLIEFSNEIKRLKGIVNRKHHNLTRQPIEGFL